MSVAVVRPFAIVVNPRREDLTEWKHYPVLAIIEDADGDLHFLVRSDNGLPYQVYSASCEIVE